MSLLGSKKSIYTGEAIYTFIWGLAFQPVFGTICEESLSLHQYRLAQCQNQPTYTKDVLRSSGAYLHHNHYSSAIWPPFEGRRQRLSWDGRTGKLAA